MKSQKNLRNFKNPVDERLNNLVIHETKSLFVENATITDSEWGNHEQTAYEGSCQTFSFFLKGKETFFTIYALLQSGNLLPLERMRGYSLIFLVTKMMAAMVLSTYPLGMLVQMGQPKGTDCSNPNSS